MKKDMNGVPLFLEVPVYYTINDLFDDKDIVYDVDSMRKTYEEMIADLPQYKNERR